MKNLFLFLTTIFVFSVTAHAQNGKVVLCEDYDKTDGTPSGINKNWDIDSAKGSYVYIIYSQDNIIKDNLMLYVDKKNKNGEYVADNTQDFTYNAKTDRKKWALADYLFLNSGNYKISVIGKDEKVLATTYTNIGYIKNKSSSSTSSTNDDGGITDTYYYSESKLVFGEGKNTDGTIKGEANEFRLINGNREITCLLTCDKALKLKKIYLSIFTGTDYKEKVSEKEYEIKSPDWDWTSFQISVTKVGKYVVDLYNENDTYINSAYFEIKK